MRTHRRSSSVGLVALAGVAAAGLVARKMLKKQFGFRDRVVLITGGSRGLGLAMARQFADEGAHIVLVARSRVELDRAAVDLENRGRGSLLLLPCDVRDEVQVKQMVAAAVSRFGRIDVLVNNAGEIVVGPVHTMTKEDWEDCMDLHFWAPLYFMQAALPNMPRGIGRIVNISSFGGKIAVPHMAPYCASKFALVGLSDSMRAELAVEGIKVTTVCPGLLRTGSHLNAMFKGDYEKEYAWFAAGAGSPVNAMGAERAARQIVEACREGRPELTITLQARAAVLAQAIAPNLFARVVALVNGWLPRSLASGPAEHRRTGWQSRSPATRAYTGLADAANRDLNGRRGHGGSN